MFIKRQFGDIACLVPSMIVAVEVEQVKAIPVGRFLWIIGFGLGIVFDHLPRPVPSRQSPLNELPFLKNKPKPF
jgi:hypothetical protein